MLIFLFDFNAKSGSQLNNVSHRTALKAVKELNGTFMCGGTVTVRNLMLQISKILMPFQVEMAKRDDQKRRERELDLNMRWGESKDGKNRDRVRDRGRSRSRSGERTPGLYVPLLRDTYFFSFRRRDGFLSIFKCKMYNERTGALHPVQSMYLHELQIQRKRRVQKSP